jgi:3-dehydroquinate synthase
MADIPGELPDAEALLAFITQDKKVSRGALTFILTRGIGQAFIARDVPASEILSFLRDNHPGQQEGRPGQPKGSRGQQKSRPG